MAQTSNPPEYWFDHEKLDVYQESISLIAWVADLIAEIQGVADIKDHLDRASTSIALNIAEGNGKYSMKDRSRFFEISMTSAMECAGALDVLVAKRKSNLVQIRPGKMRLQKIVRMLMGLIKRNTARNYQRSVSSLHANHVATDPDS